MIDFIFSCVLFVVNLLITGALNDTLEFSIDQNHNMKYDISLLSSQLKA